MMIKDYIQVNFSNEWYEPIITGGKTQTMRLPTSRWEVKEDDTVLANFQGTNKQALLEITKVGYKLFRSITETDARNCGFDSVAELKHYMEIIYAFPMESYNRVYYYCFDVIGIIEEVGDDAS